MVIIKHIEKSVELFDDNGNKVGDIENMTELANVQLQICENDLEGYYIVFDDNRIAIDRKGNLANWPDGLYDDVNKTMAKLFKARRAKL